MSRVLNQLSARRVETLTGSAKSKNRASAASLGASSPNSTTPGNGWPCPGWLRPLRVREWLKSDLRHGLPESRPSLRILSLLASAAAISVVVAAPVLLSFGRAESAALYAAFAPLCHQVAERSWTVLGYPLAVCVRCFGFYCGVFGAFCVGAKFSRTGLWAAMTATFATVALETTSILAAPPGIRFLSAAWLGLAMASALSGLVRAVDPEQSRARKGAVESGSDRIPVAAPTH